MLGKATHLTKANTILIHAKLSVAMHGKHKNIFYP